MKTRTKEELKKIDLILKTMFEFVEEVGTDELESYIRDDDQDMDKYGREDFRYHAFEFFEKKLKGEKKKYIVTVTSTNDFEVEASDHREAEDIALEMFGAPDGVTQAESVEVEEEL